MLSGRVGTKAVHDAAVRLAIASGSPIRDDLVIDTGLAHLAASAGAASPGGMPGFARAGHDVSLYLSAAADGPAR